MTLGEKIYKLRTKRSMTQEQLAEQLSRYGQHSGQMHSAKQLSRYGQHSAVPFQDELYVIALLP